jgi:hypothetical protein
LYHEEQCHHGMVVPGGKEWQAEQIQPLTLSTSALIMDQTHVKLAREYIFWAATFWAISIVIF